MNKYSSSKIYKIIDNTNSNIYIGSTTRTLKERLAEHEYNFKSFQNDKTNFTTSFIILKNRNYSITLIEAFPCETKQQLHAREKYYINNNICVNLSMSGKNFQDKTYQGEFADKIKFVYNNQKKSKLKVCVCSCGSKYTHCHKARHEKTQKHITFTLNINLN